jgi:RimK family alpha-L-glutamate ligase
MQLGLLGDEHGWHLTQVAHAACLRGHGIVHVPWTGLGACLETGRERLAPAAVAGCDALLVRGMPRGGLEEVIFRMNHLARLEAAGVLVVNPARSLEIAIDKYLTTALLAERGLAIPRTMVAQNAEAIRSSWSALGEDVVVKPLFGSGGRGLERLRSGACLEAFLERWPADSPAYLQEYVAAPDGDIRILLIGERWHAIRRRSHEWRTNISLGGVAERLQPSDAMLDLARAAAATTGTPIAGVDLLPAADGRLLVLEINAVPGWRAVARCCQADVAADVVDYLEQATHRQTEAPAARFGRNSGGHFGAETQRGLPRS